MYVNTAVIFLDIIGQKKVPSELCIKLALLNSRSDPLKSSINYLILFRVIFSIQFFSISTRR